MTAKTTKANSATKSDVEKQTKAIATDVAGVTAKASQSVADTTKAVSGLFGAFFSAGRSAVEGVIEVDKALIGYAKEAVNGYVELSKETMQAKCLNDVIDLQAAHAHARIEASAANTREVIEMTRVRAKDAYAPMKEVIDSYRPAQQA